MRAIAILSMLLTTAVTLTVGVRLLMVAARTRRFPELAFGVAFVCGGAGQAFGQIGQRALWADTGTLAVVMNGICFGLVAIGTVALWVVTRKVFRPDGAWAGWLCTIGCVVTVVAWTLRLIDGDFVAATAGTRGHGVHLAARCVLLLWVSLEATRHYLMLRRRRVLGLADPLATNQIGLWAVAGYATLGTTIVIFTWAFVIGMHPLASPTATGLLVVLVLGVSAAMWCAFFPPRALRERVERAARSAA